VKVEKDYDMVFDITREIRSMTAQCEIPNDKAELYVRASDEETFVTIESQIPSIKALVKGLNSVTAVSSSSGSIPHGCYAQVISTKFSVHLVVTGRTDVDSLITKKKDLVAVEGAKKLEKALKLNDAAHKMKTLEELIAMFEMLKAE